MKIIGIVGRAFYNKDNQKIIQINEDIRKFFAEEDVLTVALLPPQNRYYVETKMGMDQLTEIDRKKLDCLLELCDGFVIPGGTYWYEFDEYIIKHAIEKDKPLLAICLGFQALCSMFAEERTKFDMTTRIANNDHYGDSNKYIHNIKIIDNTLLENILKTPEINVNSVHHDIVDFKLKSLKISAVSSDNIIEAVELPEKKFILGVQWHPEYLVDENSKKIRQAFINML